MRAQSKMGKQHPNERSFWAGVDGTELFPRRETKLAHTHLLILATARTLWLTVSPPGRQITKLPWGGLEVKETAFSLHSRRSLPDSWARSEQTGSQRPNTYLLCLFTRVKKKTAFSLLISFAKGMKVLP